MHDEVSNINLRLDRGKSHGPCCQPNQQPKIWNAAHRTEHLPVPYTPLQMSSPSSPYTRSIALSVRKNKDEFCFIQYSQLPIYRVHFEVHQFPTSQWNDDLALIDSASWYGSFTRRLPFVDTTVGSNVSNTFRINLKQRIITQRRAAECWRGTQETRVCYFLYRLADRQDQCSVDEGYDDVCIKFVWKFQF